MFKVEYETRKMQFLGVDVEVTVGILKLNDQPVLTLQPLSISDLPSLMTVTSYLSDIATGKVDNVDRLIDALSSLLKRPKEDVAQFPITALNAIAGALVEVNKTFFQVEQ